MPWIIRFWASISKMSTLKKTEFWYSFVDSAFFIFLPTIPQERLSSKLINHKIFCKSSIRSFMCILSKLWQFFCCYQQKKNNPFFNILKTITLGVNMITRQMTPFFSCTLWALSAGIFHFCISRPSKFSSIGSPFALCSGL